MQSIDVVLLSGQTATVIGDADLTVQELKQHAQQQLQAQPETHKNNTDKAQQPSDYWHFLSLNQGSRMSRTCWPLHHRSLSKALR